VSCVEPSTAASWATSWVRRRPQPGSTPAASTAWCCSSTPRAARAPWTTPPARSRTTVPNTIDLGLGDNLPVARRLVFPVVTHGRWIEARTTLHDIATKHGVLAIAPAVAPTLPHLALLYRDTEQSLAAVIEGCGFASGIVDPACVKLPEATKGGVGELLAVAAAQYGQMALPGAA
jgi:hypothetical protein